MNLPLRALLSAGVAAAALAAPWAAHAAPVLAGTPQVNAGGTLPTIAVGATTTVDLNAPRTIIDWSSFNVANGEQVNFGFDHRGWIALNRVASGSINIDGAITGAGNVWFASPSGVIFGPNARVDVGGLQAVSSAFSPSEFLDPANLTFNLTGDGHGGSISVRAGARINATGSLALIAPYVETEAGSQISTTGDLMYGAADSYRLRFVGGGDADFSLFDFIIPNAAAGTPNSLALSLAGVTTGGHVNLFAISRASVASLLINAPGLLVATTGEVQIATGSSMITRQPFVGGDNTVPTEVVGATTGSARAGAINARTYAEVILYGATDLGDFQATDVASGATTFFTARDIILNSVDAGGNPDPFNPTNADSSFDAYGTVRVGNIAAVGSVNINPGPRSRARSTVRPDITVNAIISGKNSILGGRAISIGSIDAAGAIGFSATGHPTASLTVGSARGSSVVFFGQGGVSVDSLTATGAVAGANPFSAGVLSGDLLISSNARTTVRTATAVGNAGFSAGVAVNVSSVTASSVGLASSGSITAGSVNTTGAVTRPNVVIAPGPNAVPAAGVTALANGPIAITRIAAVGRVRVTSGADIDVGTVTASAADIGAVGNLNLRTVTVSGDFAAGGGGMTRVDTLEGGASSIIGLGTGFAIGTRISAPNLVIGTAQVVGGSGVGGLSNADFQKLVVPGRVDLYGGLPYSPFIAPFSVGDIDIGNLDVDPARIGRLGIFTGATSSITISGVLRPTAPGLVLQIGGTPGADTGDTRPAQIIVSGSIGSATGTPEAGYTDVRAFRSVELNAVDDILLGSASFADLVAGTPPDQIDIGRNLPVGVAVAAADLDRIWLTTGSLAASATQRIVSQNTGQSGMQNGLYITGEGVAATDPVLRANGAAVVDLYGAFEGEQGLLSGFSATFSHRLATDGSTTVRFNGCAVGAGCLLSTPAAEFRIEQVDAVVADSSDAAGEAVVVDPPLFTPTPQVAEDDREEDVVVTGAGNEEIWRRKP